MIWLSLLITLLAPIVGIFLMEQGAPALNFLGSGHANGATVASTLFAIVLLLTAMGVFRIASALAMPAAAPVPRRYTKENFRRLAVLVIAQNLLLLLFIVFIAGSWRVLTGQIERGEFRSSLGGLGAAAFLARDFIAPTACATAAFVYRRCVPTRTEACLMLGALIVTAAGSAVWGYKASALYAVLPAFVILFPRVRAASAIALVASAILFTTATAMLFEGRTLSQSLAFVFARASIGAGDTPWKLWDLRNQGAFPPWAPTLLSGLGGRLASVLGSWTRSGTSWYATDFSATASWIVKDFNSTLDAGSSNVTSTAFGEGVFALGSPGFLVFAVGGGVVLAMILFALRFANRRHRPIIAGVSANYFGFSYLSWINSGGVTTLVNIPHVISMGLAALMVLALLLFSSVLPWSFRERVDALGPVTA